MAALLSCFLLHAKAQGSVPRESDQDLAAHLRALDTNLLSAVHRGHRKVWAEATAPDFMYVEEGSAMPRDAFLAELEEDGQQPLTIRKFFMHREGDTARVRHIDDVPVDPGDTRTGARYLMTETWQSMHGDWKLRIVHVDAIRTAPPPVTLQEKELAGLDGVYSQGQRTLSIHHPGGRLVLTRIGRPTVTLFAEARDLFYDPENLRMRWIFARDLRGNVTGVVRRDENTDSLWVLQPGRTG